jgi:hypothetical protein
MPNQWTKAKQTGIPYVIKDETRKKFSEHTKSLNKERWSDPENKVKQSRSMKKAVEKFPESYTSSNRGRTKQIEYNGLKFQGNWELEFYKWCVNNNIPCERNTEGFSYTWNGDRTYFPDFYLPDQDVYVEVKGYQTERDLAKWNQFPKKLLKILKDDIIQIQQNKFSLNC